VVVAWNRSKPAKILVEVLAINLHVLWHFKFTQSADRVWVGLHKVVIVEKAGVLIRESVAI